MTTSLPRSPRGRAPHRSGPVRPVPTAGGSASLPLVPDLVLLASDELLAEPVHQLAAAAGVGVRTGEGPGGGGGRDTLPPPSHPPAMMLVDVDHLEAAAVRLRRDVPVLVLAHAPVPDGVFRRALDAGAVAVLALPDDRARLASLLSDLDRPRQGRVLAVTGGSGGVGASVTAAALASRAADEPTLLVDLDPWGPGLGRLLGGRPTEGITWADLGSLDGRLAASELRSALPRHGEVSLLSWPDDRSVPVDDRLVAEVVGAGARGHDWVVLDAPRGRALSPDLLGLCDLVVLVVESTVAGVAAAARTVAPLRAAGAPVGLLARQGAGAASGADAARVLEVPLLGEVGHDRRLREHLEAGLGPVRSRRSPVARAADEVLALLRSAGDGRERW